MTAASLAPELRAFLAHRHEELGRSFREAGLVWPPAAWSRQRSDQVLLASDWLIEAALRAPRQFSDEVLAPEPPPLPDPSGFERSEDFAETLRRYRRAMSLRILVDDLDDAERTLGTLNRASRLAEDCIECALRHVELQQAARYGWPRNADGRVARMSVIGMGKLGGGELNFSSDVDLILTFAENGDTDGARPISAEEFHARVGQRLAQLLSEVAASGFVLRVDYRLRPFGSAGRVALSFAAMEQYYQREGRDWERYAWTKARTVAGDLAAGAELIASLRPFVYRKYLDFTAIEGLRELKARIDAEVGRREREHDLKLGPGGIREIEFTVQLLQLIRAGREPELRTPRLLDALAAAEQLGHYDADTAATLRAAYLFLRRAENRVQMLRDEQTHCLPEDALARLRIAATLGYADVASVEQAIAEQRAQVSAIFARTLEAPQRAKGLHVADEFETRAQDALDGWSAPVATALNGLMGSLGVRRLDSRARERFERAVPRLLAEVRQLADPEAAALRVVRLLHAICGRTAYLSLLAEKRGARARLVEVFAHSAFLAERVIAHPLLLDDLLDERFDEAVPDAGAIADTFARQLARVPTADVEAELEALHDARQSLVFRFGLAWLARRVDPVDCAAGLAEVAAVALRHALALATRDLSKQHGTPGDGFLIVGYGSLGAGELGFGSDLDLVFVFDEALAERSSDGGRPLDASRWFPRLAQRVLHWLATTTQAGHLYDVDMRLRPDGAKGLPVSSLASFVEYQRERAWLWEHQALVRARAVAGPALLVARFEAERCALLARSRALPETLAEVARMRERWRNELDRSDAQRFDLKQGRGALVDIEFLLQALVLAHAAAHPQLVRAVSTSALLDGLAAAAILDAETHAVLARTYRECLSRALDCSLDLRPRVIARNASLQPWTDACAAILRRFGLAAP
ncbi:MAG: bifunctional [glutamate--ammonia ligase]-adenylyl-L-tyrosine phosphorylase/[glutamate--ammonia-ligase] adenylyltransferase [Xanthomonadales bacterium]|nr:bifunctional [glutamate--ammonia ligase]-adenylyl-L-tyrosine phosphorylase/[glutamate--ammonia-ligase] adenylyltransferase [Xanthomonadales bacterium]